MYARDNNSVCETKRGFKLVHILFMISIKVLYGFMTNHVMCVCLSRDIFKLSGSLFLYLIFVLVSQDLKSNCLRFNIS